MLNADEIFNSTAKKYDLEKYADEDMRRRFASLIESFNEHGSIPEWALPAALAQLSALVHRRLELARDWLLYPEIENECIDRPFFVVGSGRTGSTVMQTLLALGDGCRAPLCWEVRSPSPPPGLDPESDSRRIVAEHEYMRDFINIAPGLLLSHPYFDEGGFSEVEDEELFCVDLRTPHPRYFTHIPNLPIVHHKREGGLIDALRFHKKLLQHLQWKTPTTRWSCKTTQHFFQLATTWEVYPDAMCIWTHRDPVIFLSSLLALMQHIYTPITGKVIRGEIANEVANGLQAGYDAILKTNWPDDERVIHVRFDDFVRDQVGTIRHIYERHGLDYSQAYEERMRQWLSNPANKSDRHGKFMYSLEQFGLDPADIRKKFSGYYERFLT